MRFTPQILFCARIVAHSVEDCLAVAKHIWPSEVMPDKARVPGATRTAHRQA